MSQELQILRCYSCETFQVQIVRKVPKWICKMCGEKQSQKKVFFRGSGKECRLMVQDLNLKQHKAGSSCTTKRNDEFEDDCSINNVVENQRTRTEVINWNDFVTQPEVLNDDTIDPDEDGHFSFEKPKKSRRCLRNKNRVDRSFTKNPSPLEIIDNKCGSNKSNEKDGNLDVKLLKPSCSKKWQYFLDPLEKDEPQSMLNNENICSIKQGIEENSSNKWGNDNVKTTNNLIYVEGTGSNLYSERNINTSVSSKFKTCGTKPNNIFEEIDYDLDI